MEALTSRYARQEPPRLILLADENVHGRWRGCGSGEGDVPARCVDFRSADTVSPLMLSRMVWIVKRGEEVKGLRAAERFWPA